MPRPYKGDTLSPSERSQRMKLIRNRDTKPEMLVRRLVHSLGYRYRLHGKALPGTPDLIFPSRHKVVFVHGCFWHLHECNYYKYPKSRLDFWAPKLKRNQAKDAEVEIQLKELGWDQLTIWECQTKDRSQLALRIKDFLGGGNS